MPGLIAGRKALIYRLLMSFLLKVANWLNNLNLLVFVSTQPSSLLPSSEINELVRYTGNDPGLDILL
jgi:hypothetical protein